MAFVFWILNLFALVLTVAAFRSPSRVGLITSLWLTIAALAWAGLSNWYFRDGMEPGFESSTGLKAILRWGQEMIIPVGVSGFVVALSAFRLICQSRLGQRQVRVSQ